LLNGQPANLIIASDNMEQFLLSVDGEPINANSQTQVRVDGLAPGLHKLTIQVVQKNGYTVVVKSNVFLEAGNEFYYNLKKNNRNEYVLRLYNMVPIAYNPPVNNVLPPSTNQLTPPPSNNLPAGNNNTVINPQININIGGNQNTVPQGNNPVVNPPHQNPLPGYNGPIGCPYPISDAAFNEIKKTIQNNNFESTKLSIAKQVISSNCLLSKDVKEIMELFSFESSRLEFAKYAYGYTYDLGNYFIVNQAFNFESSVSELDKYIRSRR
jgi:hypothetical protein